MAKQIGYARVSTKTHPGRAAFFCLGVPWPASSCGRARSAVASSACAAASVLRAATRAGLVTLWVLGRCLSRSRPTRRCRCAARRT